MSFYYNKNKKKKRETEVSLIFLAGEDHPLDREVKGETHRTECGVDDPTKIHRGGGDNHRDSGARQPDFWVGVQLNNDMRILVLVQVVPASNHANN